MPSAFPHAVICRPNFNPAVKPFPNSFDVHVKYASCSSAPSPSVTEKLPPEFAASALKYALPAIKTAQSAKRASTSPLTVSFAGEKSPALSPRIKTPTAVLALPENVMSCENAKEAERMQTAPNTAVRYRRTACNIFKINNFILSLRVQGMQR